MHRIAEVQPPGEVNGALGKSEERATDERNQTEAKIRRPWTLR